MPRSDLCRIIGQEKTSLDFESIMNSGKILLVKMGKGRFGPVVSGLLTNQYTAQLTSSNVQPFSFATEKDARAFYPSRAKQHCNQTQKHYGMHYQDVDEQIASRRDIIYEPVD